MGGARPLLQVRYLPESPSDSRILPPILDYLLAAGNGGLCYASEALCTNGSNTCGPTNPCTFTNSLCGTGAAAFGPGNSPDGYPIEEYRWACLSSFARTDPVLQVQAKYPSRFGAACYLSAQACLLDANGCGPSHPCSVNTSLCSTGIVALINLNKESPPYNWVCDLDLPSGAAQSGGGYLCYQDKTGCESGPNPCGVFGGDIPCIADTKTCGTGASAAVGYNWICPNSRMPDVLQNGAGLDCFSSKQSCEAGGNGCGLGVGINCTQEFGLCSTGASSTSPLHNWFCQFDVPLGALPVGSGQFWCALPACACSCPCPCGVGWSAGVARTEGRCRRNHAPFHPDGKPSTLFHPPFARCSYDTSSHCLDAPNVRSPPHAILSCALSSVSLTFRWCQDHSPIFPFPIISPRPLFVPSTAPLPSGLHLPQPLRPGPQHLFQRNVRRPQRRRRRHGAWAAEQHVVLPV